MISPDETKDVSDILKYWDIRKSDVRKRIEDIAQDHSNESREEAKYLKSILKGFENCKNMIGTDQESKEKGINIEKGSVTELKKKLDENYDAADAVKESERVESISSMIKKVTIYNTNKLTEKNVVLIDSPGLGSNFIRHTKVAEDVLSEADTIVMITKPDYKFSPIDKSFLRSYETKVVRQHRDDNIVFVLNKISEKIGRAHV